MKKVITLLLVCAMGIIAAGCQGKDTGNKDVTLDSVIEKTEAQIKADLIASGYYKEEDFTEEELPGYIQEELLGDTIANYIPALEDLPKDELEGGTVIQAMMNINSDLIIVAKAKTEAGAEQVKTVFDQVLEDQETLWSQYLPDQFAKVEKAVVKQEGQFVYYVVYEKGEELAAVISEAISGK